MMDSAKKLLSTLIPIGLATALISSEGTTATLASTQTNIDRDKICQVNDYGRFAVLEVLVGDHNYNELYKVLLRHCDGDSQHTLPRLQTPDSGEFSGGT